MQPMLRHCSVGEGPCASDQLCIVRCSVQTVVFQHWLSRDRFEGLRSVGGVRALHVEIGPEAPNTPRACRRTNSGVLTSDAASGDELWVWTCQNARHDPGAKALGAPPLSFSIPVSTGLVVRVLETATPFEWINAAVPLRVRGEGRFLPVLGPSGQLSLPLVKDGRACGLLTMAVTIRKTLPSEEAIHFIHSESMVEDINIKAILAPRDRHLRAMSSPSIEGKSTVCEDAWTSVRSETQSRRLDEFDVTTGSDLQEQRAFPEEKGSEEGDRCVFEASAPGYANCIAQRVKQVADAEEIWQRARTEALIIEEAVSKQIAEHSARKGSKNTNNEGTSSAEIEPANITPISTPTIGSSPHCCSPSLSVCISPNETQWSSPSFAYDPSSPVLFGVGRMRRKSNDRECLIERCPRKNPLYARRLRRVR